MKTGYFDHIYLVNLLQHRGQRLRALAHLKSFGINPTIFEASDGYTPPILTRYDTYSRQELGSLSYFKSFKKLEVWRNKRFIDSAGAFGYIETYIRILKEAKLKGYQSILILEDDVLLSKDFNERLETFYSALPDTWKFIGLGASQYNWDSVDLELARLQGFYTPKQLDTCGSFAIAIRDTIFDELIQLQSHFEAPFDHLPIGEIYKTYPSDCFVAYPFIVMPDVRSSSIRGSRNQLTHAQKMKWEPDLFEYPLERPIINLVITSKEQTKYLDAFNDENTFPFELHLFIPSLDGLRPYHDESQVMEVEDETNIFQLPNPGYCVTPKTNTPFTEEALISLYESLISNKEPTDGFETLDATAQKIDPDRVSVIIPTYKRSENLSQVLLSVIEQDYENKEIIVVDDNLGGSDDQLKTERVVSRLIEEYSKTKLVYIGHNRNRKASGARNTGILKSTGNYICFLDDDDLYLPGRLSESIKKLKTTPRYIGAVYCGFIGGNSAARTNERYKEGSLTQDLLLLNYLAHYLNTNTATYKREAVITINGFDETFIRHQDLEFNLRFFEHYEMSVITEQLISIRPEPTTTNNQQYGINLFETKLKFLKKFQYIINRYDSATQKAIYDNHWSEVVKYVDDVKPFEQYLFAELSNGYLQCHMLLNKKKDREVGPKSKAIVVEEVSSLSNNAGSQNSTQLNKEDSEIASESNSITEEDQSYIETQNGSILISKNKNLNYWQIKGANTFGAIFNRFILPPQRCKLRNRPKAFFEDSKNAFTRFVGKLLKII